MSDSSKVLPVGTVLRSETRTYTIVEVLGQGGFGITYHATAIVNVENIKAEAHFAIKEHFVDEYCERDGDTPTVAYSRPVASKVENSRKDFLSEARRLRDLSKGAKRHPNIVCVNETFEANNTAYFVMEYLKGESLSSYVKRRGPLSDSEMRGVMEPIIDAVAFLHRERITHLDIKPANIMLTREDNGKIRPVLIDFGLSRHFNPETDEPSSTIQQAGFSEGYAPVEQVQAFKHFFPGSDVYSLGATMLFALTGRTPMAAEDLDDEILRNLIPAGLPASTFRAITEAMHHFRRHRPENAGALLAILDNGDSTRIIGGGAIMPEIHTDSKTTRAGEPTQFPPAMPKPAPQPIHEPEYYDEAPAKSKKGLYIGIGVVLLLALLCAAWFTKGFGLLKESEQKKGVASERVVASVGGEYTSSTFEEEATNEEAANEKLASEVNAKDGFSSDDIERISEILPSEDFKEVEIKTEDEIIDNTAVGTKNDYGIDDLTKAPVKHEIVEEKPKEVERPKYEEPVNMAMVEQKPQFPGGDAAMYRWLGMNIIYPAEASEEGIQGKVYIQFVIEKDGSITNAKVARSKHQALDAEALRVVKKMPKWTPGRNNGQPVRVTYIIPVTFRL